MRVNADFARSVIVRPEDRDWVPSPSGGVERCMLDRIGGEVARATSLVRFEPGSRFPTHVHGGGEEYLVLEGTFSDETGDFPAGTYVRNPIGTAHAPHTEGGCTIFVKLWQFAAEDDVPVSVALEDALTRGTAADGVRAAVLHETEGERVRVLRLAPGASFVLDAAGGAEVLVLAGALGGAGDLPAGTWMRRPDGDGVPLRAAEDGATIWVKTGHLAEVRVPEGA